MPASVASEVTSEATAVTTVVSEAPASPCVPCGGPAAFGKRSIRKKPAAIKKIADEAKNTTHKRILIAGLFADAFSAVIRWLRVVEIGSCTAYERSAIYAEKQSCGGRVDSQDAGGLEAASLMPLKCGGVSLRWPGLTGHYGAAFEMLF